MSYYTRSWKFDGVQAAFVMRGGQRRGKTGKAEKAEKAEKGAWSFLPVLGCLEDRICLQHFFLPPAASWNLNLSRMRH